MPLDKAKELLGQGADLNVQGLYGTAPQAAGFQGFWALNFTGELHSNIVLHTASNPAWILSLQTYK